MLVVRAGHVAVGEVVDFIELRLSFWHFGRQRIHAAFQRPLIDDDWVCERRLRVSEMLAYGGDPPRGPCRRSVYSFNLRCIWILRVST
ncbi:hypothetical protein ACFPRL_29225 [Pseudoclavibacter helvolus]